MTTHHDGVPLDALVGAVGLERHGHALRLHLLHDLLLQLRVEAPHLLLVLADDVVLPPLSLLCAPLLHGAVAQLEEAVAVALLLHDAHVREVVRVGLLRGLHAVHQVARQHVGQVLLQVEL